ncbi:MAG: RidA family protein [Bryobacteraceae bacterium]|nr:RidA family protein [Bryobacteraceae bacterium]
MSRRNISSGTRWESSVGYSRAVRVGQHVWVAGTTAVDAGGEIAAPGDAYGQAEFILQKIGRALAEAGASFEDVVRTRMYLTRAEDQGPVGRAHAAVFAGIRPAATMIVVAALVDPALLVEIEVEAWISQP